MEIWKDIRHYEGLYQVSNYGRVKRLERYTWNPGNDSYSKLKELILKQDLHNKPYPQVGLTKDGTVKKFLVHRLVAIEFISNPTNKPEVNHIDENKTNNNVNNLEWVTRSENINHGNRNKLVSDKSSIKVAKYDLSGNLIKVYDSATKAEDDGYSRFCICFCCKGRIQTHKGFNWEYYG